MSSVDRTVLKVTNEPAPFGFSRTKFLETKELNATDDLSRVAPGDSSPAKQERDPRRILFNEIKQTFGHIQKASRKDLKIQTENIRKQEKHLSNIAADFQHRWKKIQNKTLFLSLMRRILRNSRNFGIGYKVDKENIENQSIDGKEWSEWQTPWYIFMPESIVIKIHLVIMVFIMLELVIFFPVDLAFNIDNENQTLYYINLFTVVYFFIDMVFCFLTAIDIDGQRVTSLKKIAWKYATSWFIIDLIATIPFDLVFQQDNFKWRGLFKVPRLLRIVNNIYLPYSGIKKRQESVLLKWFKNMFSSSNTIYIWKSLLITAVFVHLSACIWCFMLSINETSNWYTR